jgi:hypothetical protein
MVVIGETGLDYLNHTRSIVAREKLNPKGGLLQ